MGDAYEVEANIVHEVYDMSNALQSIIATTNNIANKKDIGCDTAGGAEQ